MNPVFKKLNLASHDRILVLNPPESFDQQLATLDAVKIIKRAGTKPFGFAIGFAITQRQLDAISRKLAASTKGDAIVWIAYPKGSSKKYDCEFNRDNGWQVIGEAGFEPVRQIAIDEDWSALRFRRVEFIKSLKRDAQRRISPAGKRRP